MSTLMLVVYGLAFVVGLSLVPIIAYAIGPSLPEFIAEPLANALFVVGLMSVGPTKLVQTERGDYRLERVDRDELDDHEPRSYWSRWAMTDFCISYERTKEAFAGLAADRQTVEAVRSHVPESGRFAEWDRPRGGEEAFVEPGDVDDDTMLIPTGESLARLRGDGGTAIGIESVQEALKQHGGDTSQYSPKVMLGGVVLMAAMGMGMGFVVFF